MEAIKYSCAICGAEARQVNGGDFVRTCEHDGAIRAEIRCECSGAGGIR